MKVSYLVTVKDELEEFERLMDSLTLWISAGDEIVVVVDEAGGKSEDVKLYGDITGLDIKYKYDSFASDFGEWKTKANRYCNGDWIFQIDADEIPTEVFVRNIHSILNNAERSEIEAIAIPRKNVVFGIKPEDIEQWQWTFDGERINWPDYQFRLYKNKPEIYWKGRVHENLTGYRRFASLPSADLERTVLRLDHYKDILKQRQQNMFYQKLV